MNNFEEFLDEIEYELNDGAGFSGYKRKFTTDEYELIQAVIDYIRNSANKIKLR